MIRIALIALAIFAQLLTAFSRGGIVLCVHDDGSSAFEFVGALCCDTDKPRETPGRPAEDAATDPLRSVGEDADTCADYSLAWHQIQASAHAKRAVLWAPAWPCILPPTNREPIPQICMCRASRPDLPCDPLSSWAHEFCRTVVLHC